MTKIVLEPSSGLEPNAEQRLYVVSREEDRATLEEASERYVVVSLEGGLENWTPKRGAGDWEEVLDGFRGKVIFALRPYDLLKFNTSKWVASAMKAVAALGCCARQLRIPNDKDLSYMIREDRGTESQYDYITINDNRPAETLCQIVKAAFTIHRTPDSQTLFLLPKPLARVGNRGYEIGSTELREWMCRTYDNIVGDLIPGGAAVPAVEDMLRGHAAVGPKLWLPEHFPTNEGWAGLIHLKDGTTQLFHIPPEHY